MGRQRRTLFGGRDQEFMEVFRDREGRSYRQKGKHFREAQELKCFLFLKHSIFYKVNFKDILKKSFSFVFFFLLKYNVIISIYFSKLQQKAKETEIFEY